MPTTITPTIGGDTDAIRRYAAEVRAHGEDVYATVREHTRRVRRAFVEEASAHTRSGGVAPVYEELKTSLFEVMDRLDDAAAVIRREQDDIARELEDAARDFDQHDADAAARLGQIGTVDLTSGPAMTVTKPGVLGDGGPAQTDTSPLYLDDVDGGPARTDPQPLYVDDVDDAAGGPARTDPQPLYLADRNPVAAALGDAIGEIAGGHSVTMTGLPGGVPLHAKTDTSPLPHVDSIVADAIDHPQHTIHVNGLPGGVPGPHITDTRPSAASTPPDYRFDV